MHSITLAGFFPVAYNFNFLVACHATLHPALSGRMRPIDMTNRDKLTKDRSRFASCFFFSCGHATLQEALSIGPLVGGDRVEKCENTIFQRCCAIVCVYVFWVGDDVNGGCMPLPTHQQRYSDSASLVLFVSNRLNSESDKTTETDRSDKKLCCDVNLKSCFLCYVY